MSYCNINTILTVIIYSLFLYFSTIHPSRSSELRHFTTTTATYTTGPDGRRYITGGHVPIHTPATSDPEEALRNAETVMRAALSPGDPSAQDLAVAARAASRAASARAKILARSLAKTNKANRETRFDITA